MEKLEDSMPLAREVRQPALIALALRYHCKCRHSSDSYLQYLSIGNSIMSMLVMCWE